MASCPSAPECPGIVNQCQLPVFTIDCDTGLIDLALDGCETKTDCQIQSQIITALFVKGRDENAASNCRGGWWAGDIGSRLWTLENEVANDDAVRRTEQYIEEALAPLVSSGIIDTVSVNASLTLNTVNIDDILITRPDGENDYSYLWEAGCA